MKENIYYHIGGKFAKRGEKSQRKRIYQSLDKQEMVDIIIECKMADEEPYNEEELLKMSKKALLDNYFELIRDFIIDYWIPEGERKK